MRRWLALVAGLFALAIPCAVSAATCERAALDGAVHALQASTTDLRAMTVEDMQTEVPAPARAGLTAYKIRLANYLDAALACVDDTETAPAIEADLTRQAGYAPPGDRVGYGSPLTFAVKAWPGGRLGVVASLGIQCGSDSGVFVYTRINGRWAPAIRWQSPPYDKVNGAWESFDYALSPPDARGRWFLTAKSIMPWCSSTWSTIRWAILRPGPDAATPRVLRSGADSIWWGGDDLGAIKITAGSVDLRWHAASIDGGVHNRVWIRHFVVDGDRVIRTAPVALSAQDFADEWMNSAWSEASGWTVPSARVSLKATHLRLNKKLGFEFNAVRRCAAPAVREVKVTEDDGEIWFFRIAGTSDFRMLSVGHRPTPGCNGQNLYRIGE